MIFAAFLLALRLSPETPDVPLKQPQIAVAGQTVALAYGAGNSVFFAKSTDAGATFSKPVKVATAKFLALGNHRGPRVTMDGSNLVITAITGTVRFKDGNLMAWRSADGGKTWSPGVRVNDVAESAREGLHSIASANGTLWAVWLDLREKGMRLYGSLSRDAGKTWTPNQKIYESPDGHICECCHPTAYIGPKGELYAMWRNWLSGSRDMYYAVSKDGKSWSAHKLGEGTWPLNACPMDGGGLAPDSKGGFYTTWRRDGTVYTSHTSGKEVALGPGKNSAIAAGSDGPYIVWTEGMNVKLMKPGAKEPVVIGHGTFPVLAGSGPVYAAWENHGTIQVEPIQ